ncbi:MAG: spore germination protein GerW family protein [Candidatus Aminicenantales bacterium]
MKRKFPVFLTSILLFSFLAFAETPVQKKPQPKADAPNLVTLLTEAMASRLTQDLHVKHIVGQPIKVGNVTIIPILMMDIGFGGGGGGAPQAVQAGGKGFYMSGEAKPMGFVVISKAGTQFISVGKIPRK